MSFTIYKSTDGSAPVLTGQNGKLVDLLDACLVNGYGAKAAAGWAKAFAGTSKGAYRAPAGARHYYRVQDDAPGAGAAKEARFLGYESMTDVDTGLKAFPTSTQMANGLFARKSTTADATARAWRVIADSKTCYVFINTGDTANAFLGFAFGEFYSLKKGDFFRSMVIGRTTENSGSNTVENLDRIASNNNADTLGHYMARGFWGVGNAVPCAKVGGYHKTGLGVTLNGTVPYPNPLDSTIQLHQLFFCDNTTSPVGNIRGRMRGLWHWLHPIAGVTDGDTFTGAGDLAGKSFEIIKQSQNGGVYVVETSDTLETN